MIDFTMTPISKTYDETHSKSLVDILIKYFVSTPGKNKEMKNFDSDFSFRTAEEGDPERVQSNKSFIHEKRKKRGNSETKADN